MDALKFFQCWASKDLLFCLLSLSFTTFETSAQVKGRVGTLGTDRQQESELRRLTELLRDCGLVED